MKSLKRKLASLLLVFAFLISGCTNLSPVVDENYDFYMGHVIIPYSDMEYVRPDEKEMERYFNNACDTAKRDADFTSLVQSINDFYDVYETFITNYNMAYIEYCCDMTDEYWQEEYEYCATYAVTVQTYFNELCYALAESQFREQLETDEYFGADFFDAYDEDYLIDPEYTDMLEKEAELLNQYYELSEEASSGAYYSDTYYETYATPLLEIYIDLVQLRQDIAEYAGYSNYTEYAYNVTYYRDYIPAQVEEYLEKVSELFADDYYRLCNSNIWANVSQYCSEADTLGYLEEVTKAMGDTFQAGYKALTVGKLYNIAYDDSKYQVSYETYLWDYTEPFIYMCPYLNQTDKLTLAHEFGHFMNDYVCVGSGAGIDVAEIHSQAFEYLSLCYVEDAEDLAKYKMASSLCTYVETGAYAMFEHEVYKLSDEELTVENLLAIYEEVGTKFGFNARQWDKREIINIPHFFIQPMYMISYVVSNDLAMQFYQLELEEKGTGLSLYEECLYSQDTFLVDFAKNYELESPFKKGRLEEVAEVFESVLD